MTYAVVWEPTATADIDDVWSTATDAEQDALVRALEITQRTLSEAPLEAGESRQNIATRVFTWSPLTVHYRVIVRLNVVRVYASQIHHPRE